MENSEEHLPEYSDIVKDNNDDQLVDKEFEDFLFSNGVNPDKYVLSSQVLLLNQGMCYSVPVTLQICDKDRIVPELVKLVFRIHALGSHMMIFSMQKLNQVQDRRRRQSIRSLRSTFPHL